MKIYKYVILLCVIIFASLLNASGIISSYTNINEVLCVVTSGELVWYGTTGGVVRWSISTQEYTIYTIDDGLPGNHIQDVLKDSIGYLWFGSNNGVGYYDGNNWTTYTVADGMCGNEVNELAIGQDNTIWAATTTGVCYFNGNGWITFAVTDSTPSGDCTAVDVAGDGTVFVTSEFGNVWRYDESGWYNMLQYKLNNYDHIRVAPEGDIWVIRDAGMMEEYPYRYVGTVWEDYTHDYYTLYGYDNVYYEGMNFHNDAVWFVANAEVAVSEPELHNEYHPILLKYDDEWQLFECDLTEEYDDIWFNDIEFDDEGTAWIASSAGLVEFDGATFKIHSISDGTFIHEQSSTPGAFTLFPVFPNPFNPATTISYTLPENSPVTIAVYNLTGQKVATLVDGHQAAGAHTVVFDGAGLASGLYFVRLEAGGMLKTEKMVLVK